MKKRLFISIVLFLLSFGCRPEFSYYNSTADLPSYSRSVLTDAKLIKWPEDTRYSFGVVVATDVKSSDPNPISYALFVPAKQNAIVTRISDLKIQYATPIIKKDLEFLASEINKLLLNWWKKRTSIEGTYYEFSTAPEQDLHQMSGNVAIWYPSVKFGFQNTSDGSIGFLLIGPDSFKFLYKFTDTIQLGTFQRVITKAIAEIDTRERNKPLAEKK